MLQKESYHVSTTTSFDMEVAAAPNDGRKHPIVVVIHGNLGLVGSIGRQLRDFTEQISKLGYLAALPSFYPSGQSNLFDTDIDSHLPAVTAAIDYLKTRPDADASRIGLAGFSLGGGIAMAYINASPVGQTQVFADFFGFVGPLLRVGNASVTKFPPTIMFQNENDLVVPLASNSGALADALASVNIIHEPVVPYKWYNEISPESGNHAFKPGDHADVESRKRAGDWIVKYMPPIGV